MSVLATARCRGMCQMVNAKTRADDSPTKLDRGAGLRKPPSKMNMRAMGNRATAAESMTLSSTGEYDCSHMRYGSRKFPLLRNDASVL
jgi:hypothetical protein